MKWKEVDRLAFKINEFQSIWDIMSVLNLVRRFVNWLIPFTWFQCSFIQLKAWVFWACNWDKKNERKLSTQPWDCVSRLTHLLFKVLPYLSELIFEIGQFWHWVLPVIIPNLIFRNLLLLFCCNVFWFGTQYEIRCTNLTNWVFNVLSYPLSYFLRYVNFGIELFPS